VLRLGRTAYFEYQRLGLLDQFQLRPAIGPPRYSRKVVQAYLDREPAPHALRVLTRK
jgi:hypothetical protein